MNNASLAHLAKQAITSLDTEMRHVIPSDIVNIIQTHAALAVGSSLIPVPGADVAAATANIWTMYIRINNKLGISLSENLMKSIGSAVAANLASNLAVAGVCVALKFIPVANIVGGIIMAASMYGSTVGAAWIYLTAIVRWTRSGGNSADNLKDCVEQVMRENKNEIQAVINESKNDYKNNH